MEAKPPAEITIDSSLVRSLLEEQHPDLAHLSLTDVAEGWDNRLFRLGQDLAVRAGSGHLELFGNPGRGERVVEPSLEHDGQFVEEAAVRLKPVNSVMPAELVMTSL